MQKSWKRMFNCLLFFFATLDNGNDHVIDISPASSLSYGSTTALRVTPFEKVMGKASLR